MSIQSAGIPPIWPIKIAYSGRVKSSWNRFKNITNCTRARPICMQKLRCPIEYKHPRIIIGSIVSRRRLEKDFFEVARGTSPTCSLLMISYFSGLPLLKL